ncbi:dinitrogenase iron-molybdenum cofactor biosynthesis protein [Nitratidesulfovibrio sp.]|uniref:dinitrogenase iron-molybdenum cofactor biosynthesis protein n=1 Tax=Nitratidesulfovibrio sp. TaxID=2802297 RepID=UPI00334270E8
MNSSENGTVPSGTARQEGGVRGNVLVALHRDAVAPRFDRATEAWLGRIDSEGGLARSRTMVLAKASAEELCRIILTENVAIVVCCGIEQEFYDYLTWKRITVLDGVVGGRDAVIGALLAGTLKADAVLGGV